MDTHPKLSSRAKSRDLATLRCFMWGQPPPVVRRSVVPQRTLVAALCGDSRPRLSGGAKLRGALGPDFTRAPRPLLLTVVVITSNVTTVARESKTKPHRNYGGPEEEAFLSLVRTTELLSRNVEKILREADVSPTQYNVLRILRGAPDGLTCSEIGKRMITRDPDITRLLDRLEKRSLISRCRETGDRRMVMTRITPHGLDLLRDLDAPVADIHKSQLGHLGRGGLRSLMDLLESLRRQAA